MAPKALIPAVAGLAALALVATAGVATALQKSDIELVIDDVVTHIAVREDTVAEVLEMEGIAPGKHDVVLPSPATPIEDGMEITVAYGRPLEVTVTPDLGTALSDGLSITVVDVEVRTSTKDVDIPFRKTTTTSNEWEKGTTKVTTDGKPGLGRETYTDVYHDGELVSSTLEGSVVSRQPVAEVTTVGTKEPQPAPAKETASDAASSSAPQDLAPASGSTCEASYYWEDQMTANGERFDTNAMTAAHKSLPFNSRVKVTNLANNKSTIVRINDRGPYISGRCLDLSTAAMSQIGGTSAGVIDVAYEVVG